MITIHVDPTPTEGGGEQRYVLLSREVIAAGQEAMREVWAALNEQAVPMPDWAVGAWLAILAAGLAFPLLVVRTLCEAW